VLTFSPFLYRYRNLFERSSIIRHYRAVTTPYDKRPENVLAGVKLTSLRLRMRFTESMTESMSRKSSSPFFDFDMIHRFDFALRPY
jgi:hypothetical protein